MSKKRMFKRDISIIIAILVIPILAYTYLLFPEVKEVTIFNRTFTSNYYEDIQVFIWVITQKLIFVLTFMLWYATCKHWWRKILLVPIMFFISQLMLVINDDYYIVDEHEVFFSIVISIPIVYSFYILIKKIKNLISLKQRLETLRALKQSFDKELYLRELLKLKDQFSA